MKKRILSLLLTLAMLCTLLPQVSLPGSANETNYAFVKYSESERDGRVSVGYNTDFGSVFCGVGSESPTPDAEHYMADSWSIGWDASKSFAPDGEPKELHLLLDPTLALVGDAWEVWNEGREIEFKPCEYESDGLYVWARYVDENDEWYDGPVLLDSEVVKDGWRFENGVLSCLPANEYHIELEVRWNFADYDFETFWGTEENPVVVSMFWFGSGSVFIPDGISEENCVWQPDYGRMRVRVPFETEALTFTWEGAVTDIDVWNLNDDDEWVNFKPQSGSFTLTLNKGSESGEPWTWYDLNFWFRELDEDGLLCAWGDRWPGSVFWSVGDDAPAADLEHYLNDGWEYAFCFTPAGAPEPIHLLLDNSQGINWDIWEAEGRVVLEERDPELDSDGFYVKASYVDEDNQWYDGPVLIDGEIVKEGWSFENHVLSYTPANCFNIEVNVYWREADYLFNAIWMNDENPLLVDVNWEGDGVVCVPDGIREENYICQPERNRLRVRVPFETEALSFTWEGNLEFIEAAYMGEDGGWARIVPEGDSFILPLTACDEWGNRINWYDVRFSFYPDLSWGRSFSVDNNRSFGSLYQAVGALPPEKSAETLVRGEELSFAGENGEALPIQLLIDPAHVAWIDENGCLAEGEPGYLRNRELSVYAEYHTDDGEWQHDVPLLLHGEALPDFVHYENNVLTIQTEGLHNFCIEVFWSQALADQNFFTNTEEKPILVWWNNYGHNDAQVDAVYAPEGVPAEDMVFSDGFGAARVSTDTATLSFRWTPDCVPEGISSRISREDPEWEDLSPEGESFTLQLNQAEEDGSPKNFYHLLFCFAVPKPANPFTDVSDNAYYCDAVLWAVENKITGGTGGGKFSPKKTCTREQIMTFLYAAAGKPEHSMTESPFSDVRKGKWYYNAIMWAVENKITGGVGGGKFGVGKSCTREQAMTFLWKAKGSPEPTSTECRFTDVNPKKYYFKAVLWALENKITGGMSATKFGVGKTCTRAQIVTFLYKAYGREAD